MNDRYNANSLVLNTKFDLQRVYNSLIQAKTTGLSSEDFTDNINKVSVYDLAFADLLKQDFKTLDKDGSQAISSEELNNYFNSIENKGLTLPQLQALSSQAGLSAGDSKKLLDEVIQNFNKIDANNDGKVSQEEITAYKLNKEITDKKDELYEFKASDISVFYADDSASSTDSASSSSTTTTKTSSSNNYL